MKTTLSLIGILLMFVSIAILVAMETGFVEKVKIIFETEKGNNPIFFPMIILFAGIIVLIKGVSPSKNPGAN